MKNISRSPPRRIPSTIRLPHHRKSQSRKRKASKVSMHFSTSLRKPKRKSLRPRLRPRRRNQLVSFYFTVKSRVSGIFEIFPKFVFSLVIFSVDITNQRSWLAFSVDQRKNVIRQIVYSELRVSPSISKIT